MKKKDDKMSEDKVYDCDVGDYEVLKEYNGDLAKVIAKGLFPQRNVDGVHKIEFLGNGSIDLNGEFCGEFFEYPYQMMPYREGIEATVETIIDEFTSGDFREEYGELMDEIDKSDLEEVEEKNDD